MTLAYPTMSETATTWPEPFERTYQSQRRRGATVPGARRPDITWSARLLIASAVALGEARPHGMITWLADAWGTTRQSIYYIGAQIERLVEAAERGLAGAAPVTLSRNELAAATLTLLIAGTMTVRRVRECLGRIVGREPAVGWISDLVSEAGERAEAVLREADWSATPTMIVARDELYDGRWAFLLMVDPVSLSIVHGEVVESVDGDVWALALADGAQRTDYSVEGLVEDAATHFPSSVDGAMMLVDGVWRPPVQKDHWHLLRHAGRLLRQVEGEAMRALERAEAKATLPSGRTILHIREWDWEEAHRHAELVLKQEQALRQVLSLLGPALEPIDTRTDTLLDRETATWYLELIADALDGVGIDAAAELAGTIRRQRQELLTFHDWLARDVPAWIARAREHFGDPGVAALFEGAVLRTWRLERAVTNGRDGLREPSRRARMELESMTQADELALELAADLMAVLDRSVRASSAVECVNSILRQFLAQRRHLHDRQRAQHWLNLLILWHNLRPFERGKRKDLSPFELAGVTVSGPDGQPTDDWLHALGYAAAA